MNPPKFWTIAADEINDGEEVVLNLGGQVIRCRTIEQLNEAREQYGEDQREED